MYKYIEIIEDKTKEVIKRFDVSEQSDRSIEKIISGFEININHAEYSIDKINSETELPKV